MHKNTVKEIESDIISMHLGKSFEIHNEIEKIIKILTRSIIKTLGGAKINKENNIEDIVRRKFLKLILFKISRKELNLKKIKERFNKNKKLLKFFILKNV